MSEKENAGRVSEERLREILANDERCVQLYPPIPGRGRNPTREMFEDRVRMGRELLVLRAADHPAVVVEGWKWKWAEGGDWFFGPDEPNDPAIFAKVPLVSALRPATEQAGGKVVAYRHPRVPATDGNGKWHYCDAPRPVVTEDMEGLVLQSSLLRTSPPSPAATQSAVVSEGGQPSPEVKAILDVHEHLMRHTQPPHHIDMRASYRLRGPLLQAAVRLDKLERAALSNPGASQ